MKKPLVKIVSDSPMIRSRAAQILRTLRESGEHEYARSTQREMSFWLGDKWPVDAQWDAEPKPPLVINRLPRFAVV
jgi:hypothetical protein